MQSAAVRCLLWLWVAGILLGGGGVIFVNEVAMPQAAAGVPEELPAPDPVSPDDPRWEDAPAPDLPPPLEGDYLPVPAVRPHAYAGRPIPIPKPITLEDVSEGWLSGAKADRQALQQVEIATSYRGIVEQLRWEGGEFELPLDPRSSQSAVAKAVEKELRKYVAVGFVRAVIVKGPSPEVVIRAMVRADPDPTDTEDLSLTEAQVRYLVERLGAKIYANVRCRLRPQD